MTTFANLADVMRWLEMAPPGTSLDAAHVHAMLAPLAVSTPPERASEPVEATWRERLWLVPAETRIGAPEAAEAIGRPVSFVYRHTSAKAAESDRLPHRKLDGELLFVVGELRAWLRDHEEIITAGRSEPPALTLSQRRAS